MKVLAAAIVVSCGVVWMGCGGEGDACETDAGCRNVGCDGSVAAVCIDSACRCPSDPGTGGSGGTAGGEGGMGGTDAPLTCEGPTSAIAGVANDEQDPPDFIPRMRISATPVSGGASVVTRSSMTDGSFSMTVCAGATYRMQAETVVGSRYLSNDVEDEVVVGSESPVTYDIDATQGYFLDATSVSGSDIAASPGERFNLGVDTRAWSRAGCAACTYRIVVGIEGDFADWDEIGNGSYAFNGDGPSVDVATVTLDAPATEGEYGIYALIYAGTATDEDARVYYEGADGMRFPNADQYIRLATLEVVATE